MEAEGAMGGRRSCIRGDAGEDGGLEAGSRELRVVAVGRMIKRENEHGRLDTGV